MDHAISIDRSETWAAPNERLEALKKKNLPTPDNQHSLGNGDPNKIMGLRLYEATKGGDVKKFIDALEEVSESGKLALSLIFDQVTPSRNSLLHVAASSRKDDVMELILNHFPSTVTKKNSSGDTPLHVTVQDGRFNATEKLIRHGIGLEIIYWKNKDTKSPLYLAVENCNFSKCFDRKEIFQLLLEACARDEDYAAKMEGMSPILAAILCSDSVTLEEILDRVPEVIHGRGEDGGTPHLSEASVEYSEAVQPPQQRNLDMLKEIIDKLPKLLHVRNEDGGTPLHSAARVRNVGAVQLLLSKCPELALQTDKNGSYPIHIACEGDNTDIISELEKMWPDLAEIKNKKGQNILHVAAKGGNTSAVQHILKKCGNRFAIEKLVNSQDVDGNTPLHLASMQNHCEVLLYLLTVKGSDLQLRNNHNLTARDVAMKFGSSSTKYPAFVGSVILMAAGIPRTEGPDVRSPTEQGSGAGESWIKKEIDTRLVVATLVASVTFTAGIALPGGYNGFSDPNPGLATMMHNRVFKVFVIFDALATYSSILSVVILLWGHNADLNKAELYYYFAGPVLSWAVIHMTVAFSAALILAVSEVNWLAIFLLCNAVTYLFALSLYFLMSYAFYFQSLVSCRRLLRILSEIARGDTIR